jgi:hypothetical protein
MDMEEENITSHHAIFNAQFFAHLVSILIWVFFSRTCMYLANPPKQTEDAEWNCFLQELASIFKETLQVNFKKLGVGEQWTQNQPIGVLF